MIFENDNTFVSSLSLLYNQKYYFFYPNGYEMASYTNEPKEIQLTYAELKT